MESERLEGVMSRWSESMGIELNLEVSQNEYQPDREVNRLEVYESLLLDTQSALWREVLHRKERRSSKTTPSREDGAKSAFEMARGGKHCVWH